MSNRAKYQMARGKVAIIAENLGYYRRTFQHNNEEAVKESIENCLLLGKDIKKEDVCRIARLLHYPVKMELGKWIIKTTGEEL